MNPPSDADWLGWEEGQFVAASVQYYVAARFSAIGGLVPVTGNLFHHAMEMLLKAGIIKSAAATGAKFEKTNERLRKKLRHKLTKVWAAFKAAHPAANLSAFDSLMADLDRWEEIRYFEKRTTMTMTVDFRKEHTAERRAAAMAAGRPANVTEYALPLEECDEFMRTVWLLNYTPEYFKICVVRPEAKQAYFDENRHRIFDE